MTRVSAGKLLSIGVPSFNDAASLQVTLANLAPLIGHPEIEILVSDNNSPDCSSEVLRTFESETSGRIGVFVQSENLGFRGNLAFLANKSIGEYIWFLGIGERIETGAIATLLKVLRQIEPTNIVLSGLVSNELPMPVTGVAISQSRYEASTPLYSETISLNILKRAIAREGLGKVANSSGDFWPHLEVILESIAKEGSAANTVFVSNPIVSVAHNIDGWWFDRRAAYSLALSHIRVLQQSVEVLNNNIWLRKRLTRMKTIGLGEIVLRSRKNGHTFTADELRLIQAQADLNLLQQTLLRLACNTPLKVFEALSPLSKFF